MITYTLVQVFYYYLIINRFLSKYQSVGRLIFKILKYLTNGCAECHGRIYKSMPILELGGPTYLRARVNAHLAHPLRRPVDQVYKCIF